ncbi:sugar transferase [Streptomyces marianii]|uniref:sugar transferase n=1 Tax=Streptomyces marianii TaxID=1817406 RepID=UPI001F47DEAC|nr:sugar transferase [Streptomyces marianii]
MSALRPVQSARSAGPAPWAPTARPPDPKRLLDLTLGTLLLILAAPLLATAACSLALRRPPGGIVARELKTGLRGYPFTVRSLRTRRWRLDLLSRLPHVVTGEMSLVGPAALAPEDPRAAAPWRQTVRPGLTGPAQLHRRSTLPWDEPELLDQHYVEHHWIGLDLAVLARTLPALLPPRTQGALSDADHRPPGYSATE